MTRFTPQPRAMRHLLGATLALAVLGLVAQAPAQAAQTSIATFTQVGNNTPFAWANNGGTSGTVMTASTTVDFNFTTASGLSTATHVATLTISGSTNTPGGTGNIMGTTYDFQPISNVSTLTIIDSTTHQNLLSMSFTGAISGVNNSVNSSLSGNSDPAGGANTVIFSSDLFSFNNALPNSYLLGLTAMTTNVGLGPGSFLNSFNSSISGGFSTTIVPEPASIAMFGTGIGAVLLASSRRKALRSLFRG